MRISFLALSSRQCLPSLNGNVPCWNSYPSYWLVLAPWLQRSWSFRCFFFLMIFRALEGIYQSKLSTESRYLELFFEILHKPKQSDCFTLLQKRLPGSALFDQFANALTIRRKFYQRIFLQLFHRISKNLWYLLETHSTSAFKKAISPVSPLTITSISISIIIILIIGLRVYSAQVMMYTMLWGWKGNSCQVAKMGWEIWIQLPSSIIIIVIIIFWWYNLTDL